MFLFYHCCWLNDTRLSNLLDPNPKDRLPLLLAPLSRDHRRMRIQILSGSHRKIPIQSKIWLLVLNGELENRFTCILQWEIPGEDSPRMRRLGCSIDLARHLPEHMYVLNFYCDTHQAYNMAGSIRRIWTRLIHFARVDWAPGWWDRSWFKRWWRKWVFGLYAVSCPSNLE